MDMKTRLITTLTLLAVILAACAPGASQSPAEPIAVAVEPSPTPLAEAATQAPLAEAPTALPVATSRGPELEATDPSTVSLASGGLQFVEFFRFT
jgi:PBP1b-binding outer membrane lipoprotein LpoB